ncbi:penicillin-binding transpeptidase domain-containing protein [Streptomyces polyrhachis]|uniref:Penicillin-binding transpeptidase domain-containing protein n=1 Tax=Streptomyces polyrhachis TaxID=1282885 RepID=A0ABW2GDI8_9ACTN
MSNGGSRSDGIGRWGWRAGALGMAGMVGVAGAALSGCGSGGEREQRVQPLGAGEIRTVADAFLADWAAGRPARAAALTDDPVAAKAALAGYASGAGVLRVAIAPAAPRGREVPYAVTAQVRGGDAKAPWTYDSRLTVVRDAKSGKALVHWTPSVLHPKLQAGERLRTGAAQGPPVRLLDRTGAELDTAAFPSLSTIAVNVRNRYGLRAGVSGPVEIWVVPAKGAKRAATVRTTIDPVLQRAAEQQVAGRYAALVAVRPSTGEIMAVANSPQGGQDLALRAELAPGSTMKVITASLLLDKGLTASTREHPCPQFAAYGGWRFHNVDNFALPEGSTFTQSFARSCNTAFIGMAPKLKEGDLHRQAHDVFGIGLRWEAGVPTFDGDVPAASSDTALASELIGQGEVRMNPMTMASVSATVKAGVFRQPYLVAPGLDGSTPAKAPRAMKPSTAAQLRTMMKETATWGTAAGVMGGLKGDVGAKTGTAEVGGPDDKPNAWFTAYRDDLAAAALVPSSGHGGTYAGPLVRGVLAAAPDAPGPKTPDKTTPEEPASGEPASGEGGEGEAAPEEAAAD